MLASLQYCAALECWSVNPFQLFDKNNAYKNVKHDSSLNEGVRCHGRHVLRVK